jgi:hypothetical protein
MKVKHMVMLQEWKRIKRNDIKETDNERLEVSPYAL